MPAGSRGDAPADLVPQLSGPLGRQLLEDRHPPYFHDGSAATLADVVDRYHRVRTLRLTEQQKRDLVEYLKTL